MAANGGGGGGGRGKAKKKKDVPDGRSAPQKGPQGAKAGRGGTAKAGGGAGRGAGPAKAAAGRGAPIAGTIPVGDATEAPGPISPGPDVAIRQLPAAPSQGTLASGGSGPGGSGDSVTEDVPQQGLQQQQALQQQHADGIGPEGKGKGKGGGKQRDSMTKVRRPKQRDPVDWDFDTFPKLADRPSMQATVDPAQLAKMRVQAKKKIKEAKGEDPATLNREWQIKITLTGIENTTSSDWEVFLAVAMGRKDKLNDPKTRLKANFNFSKSYIVKQSSKKQLKTIEVLIGKHWQGSYKKLQSMELMMDVWMVSKTNLNQILGTGRKSLYDLANESVFQSVKIQPNDGDEKSNKTFGIGMLHLNVVVAELLEFTILASNWQYIPRPELHDYVTGKKLKLTMPMEADGQTESKSSTVCQGPRYCWAKAGEFTYVGTKTSLAMEAIVVTLYTGPKVQGKAIISLGVAGEYPIATGTVKALSQNEEQYIQGRIGGSLSVTSKSFLLDDGIIDEDSSVRVPTQPAHSLVLFHLTPKLQYLVVEVSGADGLPIADVDAGSSSPMCRVKYDGMVQQSPVMEGTTRPTWGHTFYIPVRMPDDKIRTNRDFYQRLMPVEMRSKGFLEIEVWHVDAVPTEFLGGAKLDLQLTRYAEAEQKSLIKNRERKIAEPKGRKNEDDSDDDGGDDDDDDLAGVHSALTRQVPTKVYDGKRTKLSGSWLQAATKGTVSFKCYFIPDFPQDFAFPEQKGADVKLEDVFQARYKAWDEMWEPFLDAYCTWFPDAPRKRRFLYKYQNAGSESLPLPILVNPLALPASLATPLKVMHWIKCVEFSIPPRQQTIGHIAGWQKPEDVLSLRRGSVQDHAVLLCCALLGLGKQAFVCKGTLQQGKDHAWVMTREEGGYVTFWECTTGAKFHLPNRWCGDPTFSDRASAIVEGRWNIRGVQKKWQDQDMLRARRTMNRRQHLESMGDLTALPISPWKEFYENDANIVVVPYESIEVIFNGNQLWGNLGNHHPACIYYDMECDFRAWHRLVGEDEEQPLQASKGVAIPVGPGISKYMAESMQDSIEAELKESIRMIRIRHGYESCFEEDEVLQEVLEQYLEFLEYECTLDSDWVHDEEGRLRKPWGAPSPFNSSAYVQRCRMEWVKYWNRRKQMEAARVYLPVKENHVLSGVPMHFSSVDLKEIRKNLLVCKPVLEYFGLKTDDAMFFACVKVFPMPSSVASVWIFLGAEVPLPEERVVELLQIQNSPQTRAGQNALASGDLGSPGSPG